MRIIAVMNVFNEAKNIAKAIDSIYEYVDEIWVYDGAYKEYPHTSNASTDGTLDILTKYPKVKIHDCEEAWENQLVKRTAMFENGKEGDYFFRLDGDEYVVNPELIKQYCNADIGYGWNLSNLYPEPYMMIRLIKWRKGIHYAGRHHWLFDGKNTFMASDQHSNPKYKTQCTEIRVFNFRDSSGVTRKQDKTQFLVNRSSYEGLYKFETEVYPNVYSSLEERPFRAGKPVHNETTVLRELESPKFTFSLMFSRVWAIDKYLDSLKKLTIPENTEAVIVIDSKFHIIRKRLIEYFEKDLRFGGVKIIQLNNPTLDEFAHVQERRKRIIQNWHYILTEARGEYLLASEDDSLPQSNAYIELYKTLIEKEVDFVQGNIIGRWNSKLCPAWQVLEVKGNPVAVWSMREKTTGIDEIHGTGWYCFVAKTDVFRKYPMIVDSYLPLGPDIRFGYILHKAGYKLLHRWDIKVEHFTERSSLKLGEHETIQLGYLKQDNEWVMRKYPRTFDTLFQEDIENLLSSI